ncbi:MAG: NADH:ubiquinone reductase (Na(+)-transporting) subunit C [Gammaproteobacteria bacterium]|nr:MAG: NADH:ubiquinone reductase (Na(+)-transporting) subunit C [Gammaproteobacteria bacterium]
MSKSTSNSISTIAVALTLCLVCSVLVSGVAVGLKPMQDANAQLDINKNILVAAGEIDGAKATAADVDAKFKDFTVKMVNLKDGTFASEEEITQAGIADVTAYSTSDAGKIPELSDAIEQDTAGIGRMPKFAKVYIKADADGKVESLVLPIYGAGLWGKIYGFLTLEGDANTIKGISFYSHKETPGLGALIEEDKFRGQFPEKKAYSDAGDVAISVTKAGLAKEGLNNFVQFWLSDKGYKNFLTNLSAGKAGEV